MKRPVTIRVSLLRNLLPLVLVLGAVVFGASLFGTRYTTRILSKQLIDRTLDLIEARLHAFFRPVDENLRLVRAWSEAGLLPLDDPAAMGRLFVPLLRRSPQISSLEVADDAGNEYMLLHAGDHWRVRLTRPAEWGHRTRWLEWSDAEPTPKASWKALDYDPRARPWYRGALARLRGGGSDADSPYWTPPYTFFTAASPGITAAKAFRDPDGRLRVVGVDVLLSAISDLTLHMKVSEHGKVAVLSSDGRLLGLPRDPRYEDPAARRADLLKQPAAIPNPFVLDASRAFRAHEGKPGLVRFISHGDEWLGRGRNFALGSERHLMLGVVVPLADLFRDQRRLGWLILLATAAALGFGVRRAVLLARRYGRPLAAIARQSDEISRGNLDYRAPVESPLLEVRRLSESHERMRRGLQTLLRLERDLQLAREIQRSTLPERIPHLPGFEIAGWSEPAEETGGDIYDVVAVPGQPDRVVLLLADATGHGIGPALSATQVRAMLRMALRMGGGLEEVARHINEQLCDDLHAGRFVTAWLGELDAASATLTTLSAGQGALLHYHAEEDAFTVHGAGAPPLGVIAETELRAEPPLPLAHGDLFLVMSDGVLEATNSAGTPFGLQRVQEVVAARRERSAAEVVAGLQAAVDAFSGAKRRVDDCTALVIRRGVAE